MVFVEEPLYHHMSVMMDAMYVIRLLVKNQVFVIVVYNLIKLLIMNVVMLHLMMDIPVHN